jgi:hypothetical protein
LKESNINDGMLRDYLLGKLSQTDREDLEGLYISDEDLFGRILIIEDDLIEQYQMNELSDDDRILFQKRHLSTKTQRREIELRKALREESKKPEPQPPAWDRLGHAVQKAVDWLGEQFALRSVRWAALGTGVVVVAAVIAYLLVVPPHEREKVLVQTTTPSKPLVGDIFFVYQSSGGVGTRGEIGLKTRSIERVEPTRPPLVLTQDDRYAVQVQPESTIFLYVLQWDTLGKATVLFPDTGITMQSNPVMGGMLLRLPPSPHWFSLDEKPGIETIVIAASANRWTDLERWIDVIKERGEVQKAEALTQIRQAIRVAEGKPDGAYYGKEFSFLHKARKNKLNQ